ncbi:MAG: lipopolysaccharide heptosyltransferase II, partial [Anaerolineae bacterium]
MSERFLVVCQAWVGDVVMAGSLLKFLRQRHPDAEIDVLAPEFHGQVVRRMPEVTNFIPSPGGHGKLALREQIRLGRALRRRRYTRAIVLPRSIKSALVPFIARAKIRTGFLGEQRRVLLNDIREGRDSMSTADGFIALGLEPGDAPPAAPPEPQLRVDTGNQARLRERLALDPAQPVAALAPGAEFGPAKQWPVEHFAETARALARSGRKVIVLGSPKETETGAAVAAAAPGVM